MRTMNCIMFTRRFKGMQRRLVFLAIFLFLLIESHQAADFNNYHVDDSGGIRTEAEWTEVIASQKMSQKEFRNKAAALVSQMTLDEKLSLYLMDSGAIERLGIPQHHWWNEALSGVARNGKATQFPQAIAMASTWDPELILNMADAIGKEARAKHHSIPNQNDQYQGLTIWSPTINMARDPRWGRNEETYGEDPLLTSLMAVSFVRGLQGTDPKYYQAIATVKHFLANNSERYRYFESPPISERALREYYMPAYKAAVQQANVQSVMSAYNGVNGVPMAVNKRLLTDVLRNEWGFSGTVVTDVHSSSRVVQRHRYYDNMRTTLAAILNAGVDVNSDRTTAQVINDLKEAIRIGLTTEEELDRAITQNLTTRMQLGQIVDDRDNPFKKISLDVVGSEEHLKIARQIAQKGTVLLQNRHAGNVPVLPIRANKIDKIYVAGPYANIAQLGGYSGVPTKPAVTPYEGIRKAANNLFDVEQFPFYGNTGAPVPQSNLRPPDGMEIDSGLKAEYFSSVDLSGGAQMVRVDGAIDFDWPKHSMSAAEPRIPLPEFSVRWTGSLIPDESGNHQFFAQSSDGMRVWLEGKLIVDKWAINHRTIGSDVLNLKAGYAYDLRVEYFSRGVLAFAHLTWLPPSSQQAKISHPALQQDSSSVAVVYVAGFNLSMADEFRDLTNLSLPNDQKRDIQEWLDYCENVVVVLNGGTIIADSWLFEKVPAVMHAWYPGQEGGDALADLLFGQVNPSGRLPLTWYHSTDVLPDINDYEISNGRTYQYYRGLPLFPFGHGLSYTSFKYADIIVSQEELLKDDILAVRVLVENTGQMLGEEVVQVYVRKAGSPLGQPTKRLVGFGRVEVLPGDKKFAHIDIPVERFVCWDENQKSLVVEPGRYNLMIGASSEDIRETVSVNVR